MRKKFFLHCLFFMTFFFGSLQLKAQSCDPINASKLKEMLGQLGYTVKDIETNPGSEKYEIKVTKDGIDVPILYQLSASGSYMWLTVSLGNKYTDESVINSTLLKQNSKIQPCQFYTTESGKLMMGLAVDNRGINNAQLRRYTEFITGKVIDTKAYWLR